MVDLAYYPPYTARVSNHRFANSIDTLLKYAIPTTLIDWVLLIILSTDCGDNVVNHYNAPRSVIMVILWIVGIISTSLSLWGITLFFTRDKPR